MSSFHHNAPSTFRLARRVSLLLAASASFFPLTAGCVPANRTVVENHALILVVDNPSASLEQLREIATNVGGFIDDSSVAFSALEVPPLTVYQATFTMRIPPQYLQQTINRIQGVATETARYNVARQDFTVEQQLLEARRHDLEGSRESLLRRINQQQSDPQDTNLANDLLNSINAELHSIDNRLEQLQADAALSYVFVELMPVQLRQLVAPDT